MLLPENTEARLHTLSNRALIQLSEELNQPTLDEEGIARSILPENSNFAMAVIELNVLLRVELASRLNQFVNS